MISLVRALDNARFACQPFYLWPLPGDGGAAALASQVRAAEQNGIYVLALGDCRVK